MLGMLERKSRQFAEELRQFAQRTATKVEEVSDASHGLASAIQNVEDTARLREDILVGGKTLLWCSYCDTVWAGQPGDQCTLLMCRESGFPVEAVSPDESLIRPVPAVA